MDTNNQNKELIKVEEESFFSKIRSFFKRVFGKKESAVNANEVHIENAPSPSQIDLMRTEFNDKQEKKMKVLEIQEKYENGEYDLSMLTDEEVAELMFLYHSQIKDYRKRKDDINKKLSKMNG